ncbi:hypothetical protein Lfu02_40710 [Longispora fulva]|uniref:Uncharacterized protein n=1 Tax=Longispora fulva TaxID=619741 RepID=A0A8J7GPG1_9ACTN|nr:hypothetical protein [Longispora fulva]MBG6136529.1 hypothetical protein [Longispora fulva]GIG59699.1 hypothetical protein Lfu02_40710 [Longispora fulva]
MSSTILSQPLQAGDVVRLTKAASPQFGRPLLVRVVAVIAKSSVGGWGYLEGYVLDDRGDATARRRVFVNFAGLKPPATGNRK